MDNNFSTLFDRQWKIPRRNELQVGIKSELEISSPCAG
ncbi:hypothetical protein H206_09788 [Candidatus Electrothrix aarhusensis]|uniref:Uncharacterized protein n=1 Tax=Candidatus Electrothrix aarhusensis TaxID=1859131 RepID=A0A444J1W7_9BACT|nr:hypothetical protein H206_09788 [Candidatus Electrothrix aarhusensis]